MFGRGGTSQFVHPAGLVGRPHIAHPPAPSVQAAATEMVWALGTIRRVVELERLYFAGRPEIETEMFNVFEVGQVLGAVDRFSMRFQASYFPLLSFEVYDLDDIPLSYLDTLPVTVSGVCYESDTRIEGEWFFGEEGVLDVLMCLVMADVYGHNGHNGHNRYGDVDETVLFPALTYAYPELRPPDCRVEWTTLIPYIEAMGLDEPLCYLPTMLQYVLKETGNGWLDYSNMEIWEAGEWYTWDDTETVGELRQLWGEAAVMLNQIGDLINWCEEGTRPERCQRYQVILNVLTQAMEMERGQLRVVFS